MPTVDICSPGGEFTPAAVGDGVTDDAPAFRAFNTWAQAQVSPITLTLGSGSKTFLFDSADSDGARANSLAYNVTQPLTVTGNGRSTTIFKRGTGSPGWGSGQLKSGNAGFGSSSIWTARLDSVSAGRSTVTCKTPADTDNFSENTWALLTGIDMQAGGQPPNPFFFEYVYITDINAGTGVITFQSPIINDYLDTWPVFFEGDLGLEPDAGGPATLYALDAFDVDVTYQSLGFQGTGSESQHYPRGRTVNFVDFAVTDGAQLAPTLNKLITFTNCDMTGGDVGIEFDKLVYEAIYDGCPLPQMIFQSAGNIATFRNGCSVTTFNGTPRFLTIAGSSVTEVLRLGATAFGRTERLVIYGNSTVNDFNYNPVQDEGPGDVGISSVYTIADGVITVTKADIVYGCRWQIPGTRCAFSNHNETSFVGDLFTVLSVVDNGATFTVTTDYPGSTFPKEGIRILPFMDVDVAADTVTGNALLTSLKAQNARMVRVVRR